MGLDAPAHKPVREAIGRARWPRLITPVFNSGSAQTICLCRKSMTKNFTMRSKERQGMRLSVTQGYIAKISGSYPATQDPDGVVANAHHLYQNGSSHLRQ